MKHPFALQPLSDRSSAINPSTTMLITDQAKALTKAGNDVISFSAGEPDFKTPDFIKDAAIDVIRSGWTGYTSAAGLPQLKESICRKLKRDHALDYSTEQIVISNGAKHSIYNALQATISEGDEVLIPAPYWVSYPEMVRLNGGVPVFVPLNGDDGFAFHEEILESFITPRSKVLIINSPCNPTGVVYDYKTLKMLGDFACRHNLYIISDEIYEKLIYEGEHVSLPQISQAIKDRTILINGMSKAYSMTGWRIGYMAAPLKISQVSGSIQSHSTSNANTIAQYASIVALDRGDEILSEYRGIFHHRRDLMLQELSTIPKISVIRPQGAFYIMVDISKLFGQQYHDKIIHNDWDFSQTLLESKLVATVPGSAFGDSKMIRIAYACSDELIIEGIRRIKEFVLELHS